MNPVAEPILYVILREHEEYGPFCMNTLREAMESGNLVAEDWVRTADRTSCWMSLGQLLYGPPEPERPMVRIRWVISRWVASLGWAKARCLSWASQLLDRCCTPLETHSGTVALACILVATGIVLLPERPFALSIPWMTAGVLAGMVLIRRRRSFRGAVTCLASLVLPFIAFESAPAIRHNLDPNRRENALPPIGEMYSSMPRRNSDLPKRHGPVASGIPALGLPEYKLAEE
jgi:hypothetical protein